VSNYVKSLVLASVLLPACSSIFTSPTKTFHNKHTIADILESNVIVHHLDKPVCGGTIVGFKDEKIKVLTAAHCVLDDDNKIMRYGFIDNSRRTIRVKVLDVDRNNDLALLETTETIPKAAYPIVVTTLRSRMPDAGEPIWLCGFGAGQPDILSHGTIALVDTFSVWTGVKATLVDATGFYGNSGGAVYSENGQLLGVVIQIGPAGVPRIWLYVVHYDIVKAFLTQNKLP